MYKHTALLFNIFLVIVTLISLYILLHKLYYKEYKNVHSWHFPMLVAICIETFI